MRIRKRLALCSIPATAPPPSDPHLRRSEAAPPPHQENRWASPKPQEKIMQKQFADDHDHDTNNDIREIVNICDGGEGFNINLQPSSSSLQVGCCEEEEDYYKVVPLKKRKGIFERNPNEETATAKMKSKTNKKCGDNVVPLIKPVIEENGMNGSSGKKIKRGNVIMEGSRCSRVNGRGWRCCQPTLVGYSLCEHHLGKGRARSMTSARKQQMNEGNSQPLSSSRKKRSKVGVVKARSMSSLLSQI
ncbi:hypothetical protein C2S51_026297 [Perilla frutescens var. frutescens]|nr:hypothetical protein C2S51_026297 [Perilla frutescens var. frutescens]